MNEVVDLIKDNATRYIKTTSKALVEHLCKYLAMRIGLDLASSSKGKADQNHLNGSSLPSSSSSNNAKDQAVKDLTIYIASVPGQMTPLGTQISLTQVNEKFWKVNKPMEMFYSFKRT
jgi:E3 ubiquitin-protein ligase RNF1/2